VLWLGAGSPTYSTAPPALDGTEWLLACASTNTKGAEREVAFGMLVVALTFWGWMFWHMISNDDLTADEKQDWTLAFILLESLAQSTIASMCIVTGATEVYGDEKRRCGALKKRRSPPPGDEGDLKWLQAQWERASRAIGRPSRWVRVPAEGS
jgi:hypothetical protein